MVNTGEGLFLSTRCVESEEIKLIYVHSSSGSLKMNIL